MQNTTFFGHSPIGNIIVLESTTSTNDYLKHLLTNFTPHQPFTAIMAKEQTHGKGQRGANWQSTKGQNLTASFAYLPKRMPIHDQFALTIISSLSIYDTIKQLQSHKVYIKWPNDIYVENKKIAGVLIENKIASMHIKHAIIGIGLNVYQKIFTDDIAHKTTALVLENFETNVTILDLVKKLQERLKYYSNCYENGQADQLLKQYNECLFRKDILASYKIEDRLVVGKIKGVAFDGLLQVEIDEQLQKFDLKEIQFC